MPGLQTGALGYSPKQILSDEGTEVSYVSGPVNGRTAAVEPEGLAILGEHLAFFPRQGVVQKKGPRLLCAHGGKEGCASLLHGQTKNFRANI